MSAQHRLLTLVRSRRAALLAVIRRLTINGAAALAVITAMTTRLQGVSLLLAAVAIGVLVWSRWSTLASGRPENLLGAHAAARSLVIIAVLAIVTDGAPGARPDLALTAFVLVMTIGVETSLRGLWTHAAASSVRVPGLERPGGVARLAAWAVPASLIATVALGAVVPVGETVADAAILIACIAWTFVLAIGVLRAAQARALSRVRLAEAVAELAPQALLIFSGPAGSGYQAQMWLPLLERTGLRIVVVLREAACLPGIAEATRLPVVVARTMAELEATIAPSVTTAFYVNNSAKNGHAIRFGHLTHVQLLHGDSDKPSSFNPVTAMFDRIFVAGQAGIDRYAAHGVDIPERKFTIVGRPQVAGITRPAADAAGTVADVAPGPHRVLYAPTWTGFYGDANYCSLPIGEQLVRALLALDDAVVTFRPHPYSRSHGTSAAQISRIDALLEQDAARTGRAHVFGAAAALGSVTDAFNDSDALVADVSSVPADYLFSGKPFVITQMTDQDAAAFDEEFPLAQAGYRVQVGTADAELRDVIAEMLGPDPLGPRRADMARYYLGDVDSGDYEAIFLDAARAVATAEKDVAP